MNSIGPSVGYIIQKDGSVDTEHVAIYKDLNTMLCSFTKEEGKQIARLMMNWFKLDGRSEFSDSELIEELQYRGYTGTLRYTKEIKL